MNVNEKHGSANTIINYILLHHTEAFKPQDVKGFNPSLKNLKDIQVGLDVLVKFGCIRKVVPRSYNTYKCAEY